MFEFRLNPIGRVQKDSKLTERDISDDKDTLFVQDMPWVDK